MMTTVHRIGNNIYRVEERDNRGRVLVRRRNPVGGFVPYALVMGGHAFYRHWPGSVLRGIHPMNPHDEFEETPVFSKRPNYQRFWKNERLSDAARSLLYPKVS